MRLDDAWAQLHRAADIAAARGSLLFHLDLATELARVAFVRRGELPAGLATLAEEDGYRTLAFDTLTRGRAVAQARFTGHGEVEVSPAPNRVPPRAASLAGARATIAAARFEGAAEYGAVVIPANDPRRALEGYALAVGTDPDVVQAAGHWLVTLSPSGKRITAREPLVVTTGAPPRGVGALRDTVLAIPGAVPSEIHTYLSLKHGVPMVVEARASGVSWRIDGERTAALKPAAL